MEKINNLLEQYVTQDNDVISNLANISAIVYNNLDNINWFGFYLVNNNKADELILGPFQGLQAVTKIPFSSGVCGKCATTKETIIVEDVHCFEGHIACDLRSESEMVVPIFNKKGELFGVLDVDSPIKKRFGIEEESLFKTVIAKLEETL